MLHKTKKTTERKSIPNSWCDLWTDINGKKLIIEPIADNFYNITVLNNKNQPYKIDLLNDEMGVTKNLTAKFVLDVNNNPILQVEAGTSGLGPTYNLCFLTSGKKGNFSLSKNKDAINNIIIRPKVEMGLYDDWDDDLGVSWAFPLNDFKKKKEREIDSIRRMTFYLFFGWISSITLPQNRDQIVPFLIRFLISATIIGTFIYLAINFL